MKGPCYPPGKVYGFPTTEANALVKMTIHSSRWISPAFVKKILKTARADGRYSETMTFDYFCFAG